MNDLLKKFTLPLVMLSLLANACATPTASPTQLASKVKAVATFSIISDLVKNVAGDKIELTTLVGPGGDTHDFEPNPSDSAKLADAQIIFENGLGFENWLDNLYQSSGSQATRLAVSNGIQMRKVEEAHGHEGEAKEGQKTEETHAQGESDPHVWQNVQNAMQMVKNIRDGLSKADAANAETYKANADAYLAKLEALDKEVTAIVEQLPEDKRKLVTSHDALGYFADRYGFEIVGSILASAFTAAGEPSAQDIVKLVDAIKAQNIKAIFLESISNPQLVERVAQEAGVKVGPGLYTDALGEPGSSGATYVDAMRYNAQAIVEALK